MRFNAPSDEKCTELRRLACKYFIGTVLIQDSLLQASIPTEILGVGNSNSRTNLQLQQFLMLS